MSASISNQQPISSITRTGEGTEFKVLFCNDAEITEKDALEQCWFISKSFTRNAKTLEKHRYNRVEFFYNPTSFKIPESSIHQEKLYQMQLAKALASDITLLTNGCHGYYGFEGGREPGYIFAVGHGAKILRKALMLLSKEVRPYVTAFTLEASKPIPNGFANRVINYTVEHPVVKDAEYTFEQVAVDPKLDDLFSIFKKTINSLGREIKSNNK